MNTAILSVDIGTSSTRAILYDATTGAIIEETSNSITHEPTATTDGGSTLDADALVEEAISCMVKALAAAPDREIGGVGVSTFWHSTIGVDAAGNAVTPILLWSDRRSAPQVAALRHEMDVVAYTQRTGCPLHTSYLPGRLRWLAETQPEKFTQSARFLSPGEYLYSRLFGRDRITQSFSIASGTGLYNATEETWDSETLEKIPGLTSEQFSHVGDDPVSGLLPPFQERLSRLSNVPFFPALGDGACSNLGAGGVDTKRMVLMIGTSGAIRVLVPGNRPPEVPDGLWRYRADRERFLVGGALSNGGSVWAWLTETLHLPDLTHETMEDTILALPPDGHGLTVLPFFAGERAPLWQDDLTAAIVGLTQATTPLQIARAAMEAVAYRFAAIRERLRAVAPEAEVIGSGGALLHSPAWGQIIADVLGEPLTLSAESEGSSRGVALWVRERLGKGSLTDASFAFGKRFEPNRANSNIYATARKRHEALLAKLG